VNLAIPAVFRFARMLTTPGAHLAQIDIHKAPMQMIIGLDSRSSQNAPWRFLRRLYSCAVRPAINRMLWAMTSPPASFTKRCTSFDDIQPRAALTFVP
jgi:hypothetical protein